MKRTVLYSLIVALALLTGCAFLNTFYHARQAFNTGYREHERQMRDNPDSLTVPAGKASSQYDRAIEKSQKVLDVYTRKKKWHDDAIFLMARSFYYKNEFSRTIRLVKRLQKEFPESPFVPRSWVLLGKAYLMDENPQKAEEAFQVALERYPQLNRDDEISLLLARIAIAREGKVLALEMLEKVLASLSSPDKKLHLIVQIAELTIELKQYTRALSLLKSAPRREKELFAMYRVRYLMSVCYLNLDSLERGHALIERTLADKRYDKFEDRLLLQKGAFFQALKEFDKAIELYEGVTVAYANTVYAGDAFFELGKLYQKWRADFTRAKECFEKAVALCTNPDKKELAQKRIDGLSELARLRGSDSLSVRADDSTALEEPVDFIVGELFWLELDEPDSAYNRYMTVVTDTGTSADILAKSLYAAIWITLHAREDTTSADSLLSVLVDRFPHDPYSKSAQQQLERVVTVTTREDSAQAVFKRAERLFYEKGDTLKAANSYLKVYKKYSDLDIGAQALFHAAWLCDYALFKKETALSLYRTLCERYPESDYCVKGAKTKVETALDTLNVIKSKSGG